MQTDDVEQAEQAVAAGDTGLEVLAPPLAELGRHEFVDVPWRIVCVDTGGLQERLHVWLLGEEDPAEGGLRVQAADARELAPVVRELGGFDLREDMGRPGRAGMGGFDAREVLGHTGSITGEAVRRVENE